MLSRKVENFVHSKLEANPWIKNLVKKIYQHVYVFFSRSKFDISHSYVLRHNAFFGFHDKDPWSQNKSALLAHEYEGIGNEIITSKSTVNIVLFHGKNWLEKRVIGSTSAWNWQQGSELQWLDNDTIIFNDFVDGRLIAKSVNTSTLKIKNFKYPVSGVNISKGIYASTCFQSFAKEMPGYGYIFDDDRKSPNKRSELLLISLKTGTITTCIDMSNFSDNISDEFGCISHIQFSEDGRFCAFLVRKQSFGVRLYSEMWVFDTSSWKTTLWNIPFGGMVSHYCFIGHKILVYASDQNKTNGFFEVSLIAKEIKNVSEMYSERDGHPSFRFGCLSFDTYPDGSRHKKLFVRKSDEQRAKEIGTVFLPLKFDGISRVDLHPRVRSDGKFVCVDCVSNGVRSMCTIDLS